MSEQQLIKERDKNTCQKCGEHGTDVHHIIPLRFNGRDTSDNKILLCKSCHKKQDNLYLRYGVTNYVRQMLEKAKL